MGTTLVAVRFPTRKRQAYVVNVGDSRCYRVRDGVAEQVTRDHTAPLRPGRRRPELARALGMSERPAVDLHVVDTRPGDHFLLCSDGLWTHVTDAKMATLVSSRRDLEEIVRKLVAEAVHQGTRDDVSVVLVRVTEPDA